MLSEPVEILITIDIEGILPPKDLTFNIIHDNNALLTWNYDGTWDPEHYLIYKNGIHLGNVSEPWIYERNLSDGEYVYGISHIYEDTESEKAIISFTIPFVSEIGEETPVIETKLIGNYPNPFNPETTISFSTSKKENVEIIIYNIKGQKVITLTNEIYDEGKHIITWNGSDDNNQKASSGIYFYRMRTEDKTQIRKMILLK